MASAHGYSNEDRISCSLCLDIFKDPRNLLCGHTFCLHCLQNHISANNDDNSFSCPNCRDVVSVPDIAEPTTSWASQFPRNLALVDAIGRVEQLIKRELKSSLYSVSSIVQENDPHRFEISSICATLKSSNEFLKCHVQSEIQRLHHNIDVSVTDVTNEIERRGDELIVSFTTALQAEKARLKEVLEQSHVTTNDEITKLFSLHADVIEQGEAIVKLGEKLLESGEISDIRSEIYKFKKMHTFTLDFLTTVVSKSEISDIKVALTDPETRNDGTFSVAIGTISKPDLKLLYRHHAIQQNQSSLQKYAQTSDVKLIDDLPTSQTVTWENRKSDKLIPEQTFNTKVKVTLFQQIFKSQMTSDECHPLLQSILVLEGQRLNKLIVTDVNNNCVKAFCCVTSALLSKFKVPCSPIGLAKSPDDQVLLALPWLRKIVFLNITNDIKETKVWRTLKEYYFLAVLSGDRLAASECKWGGCVDILGKRGDVMYSLPIDVIPSPGCLAVNEDSLIIVSEWKSLICVTGCVMWQSRDSLTLHNLVGVTCDVDGFIYACDSTRNCVVQLSRDGEIVRDVLTERELCNPQFVCCSLGKLYVAQENGDIKVFTWTKA